MSLFVDSSVWFAAADRHERSHGRARELLASADALVTSDHVVVETWGLLKSRIDRQAANRFWDATRTGGATVEWVGAADLEGAWSIREAFPDQRFSIVDLTSFVVMERLGIYRVASFDSDFAIYRFGPRRERAFTVLN